MVQPQIRVIGLKELRRDLKKVGRIEERNELRDGLKAAAGIAATEAKQLASVFSQRAADTIRPTAGGNRAYVVGGKASLSWYGWADFGSRSPVTGNPRSMGPWKGSGVGPEGGRFIYKAIDNREQEVTAAIERAVFHALQSAGF